MSGLRYPRWAVALCLASVASGIRRLAVSDYGTGETNAMALDFAASFVITWAFWYGVVMLVGWAARWIAGRFDRSLP